MAAKSQIVICTYRVKAGKEPEFLKLLAKHWPTLKRLDLVEPEPRMVLRGLSKDNRNELIEIFAWNERGYEVGHKMPEVLAIWEPMEQLCEPRGGRPAMEFPHYETIRP